MPGIDSDKSQRLVSVDGTPPDLFAPPAGCAFAVRCERAMRLCYERYPEECEVEAAARGVAVHKAACWLVHPEVRALMPQLEAPER